MEFDRLEFTQAFSWRIYRILLQAKRSERKQPIAYVWKRIGIGCGCGIGQDWK